MRTAGRGWLDIAHGPGYAVATLPGLRCRERDPERRTLDALLQRRYAPLLGDRQGS